MRPVHYRPHRRAVVCGLGSAAMKAWAGWPRPTVDRVPEPKLTTDVHRVTCVSCLNHIGAVAVRKLKALGANTKEVFS